jgi:hypothetical protein
MAGKDHILPSGALACPLDLLPNATEAGVSFLQDGGRKPEAKAARVQGLRKARSETPPHPLHGERQSRR